MESPIVAEKNLGTVALASAAQPSMLPLRPFGHGSRPVIRWIKGDGLDHPVTRTAIAQATRLFGDKVDYCICTIGISASRVRQILSWATQPVEWHPLSSRDNPDLASVLLKAGCSPDRFGYWWKWFPERVRPGGPEWILDGDMVVTAAPAWFKAWSNGRDGLRVSQDNHWPAEQLYGEYLSQVDQSLKLYSGLISLPAGLRYLPEMLEVLANQPLAPGHDGCTNMSEQGVVAAAFSKLRPATIPLSEFPFARAFEPHLDYGFNQHLRGIQKYLFKRKVWGYHFGHSFLRENLHFKKLCDEGVLFTQDEPAVVERFAWLGNFGQWGRPGWSMNDDCARRIADIATRYAARPALEIGTSRGHLAAIIASQGCLVTTIDAEDRGARQNLDGLDVEIINADAAHHLEQEQRSFDFIVVDLHGNDEPTWRKLWPRLKPRLSREGTLILYNSHLWKIDEFRTETGLRWVAENCLGDFSVEVYENPPPGMLVCRYAI